MKIVVENIIFELQRAGGVSVYWRELISRLKNKQTLFFGRENNNIFGCDLALDLQDESYPRFISRRYLPFWPKPDVALKEKHVFHSSYFRYSNSSYAINVTTVHDFTYEYFNHGVKKWVHGRQKKLAVKKSSGIICVSENTKKDLLKFYPWLDERFVRVIYNGVGSMFHPHACSRDMLEVRFQHAMDKPFILFVGDRSPYKNFCVFVRLADEFPDFDLVVVGGAAFTEDEQEWLAPLGDRIKHFCGVAPEDLNLLYNAAFCLVYPSSYEGFGIPVLEAMKAGCPVVSTNLSSIPEVAGEAALLVDRVDVESFSEQIRRLLDEPFRQRLVDKGLKQAYQFSWDKCFDETYAFYQELWERSDKK